MPSEQFLAYQRQLAASVMPPPPPPRNMRELRTRIDESMSQHPLAEGTTAVEVSADGVVGFLQERERFADDPLVVYFHGGAYRTASALAYRAYCSNLAARAGVRVLNVHYRLAPEHPFPAAVDDALAAYEWVLSEGTPPARVVVAGDSAGAGLAVAALVAARTQGTPLPAGAVCLSPWVDLTNSGDTYRTLAGSDLISSRDSLTEAANLYLQGHDPTDPLVSPVF